MKFLGAGKLDKSISRLVVLYEDTESDHHAVYSECAFHIFLVYENMSLEAAFLWQTKM